MDKKVDVLTPENIAALIYLIRGQKVMLDRDLAGLYEVETKVLKQAVRRNIDRFPEDFMFELSGQEFKNLRSQFVTSSLSQWGGARYKPMVFTEQGVAMLSSVLRSKRAIQVNIHIMRAFTKLRQLLLGNEELRKDLAEMKKQTDERFQIVFETLDQLLSIDNKSKRKIGFEVKEPKSLYGKRSRKRRE